MAGLRERKKQRTRQALVQAAFQLFGERGFEETTLADIAAQAEISTRTFFSYFASKDDLIFHDTEERLETATRAVVRRTPEEPLMDVLRRLVDASVESALNQTLGKKEAAVRTRLILTEPSLQARGLHLLFDTQLRLARTLHGSFAGELSMVEAAAAIGALIGAVKLAVVADLRDDRSFDEILDTARRAAEIAISGLRSLA
ncbi:TetR/AcrR family transcriptional regulator [Nonomuraea fuscirosea]|jgi:AcrR family transcriptional regulator|uniref:TetR family transcriptional regulator n=1 Tax=Nonomuraea fuscirosea TaxID=1291556 RepID=UPI002DDBEC2E|nr:TetR family transcriptional regulator [Nonomuraea fuscirosea]WSA48033.1 TetR/AcrR family transcriptional regulator [Nonomuraea fuscirosea]